MGLHPVSFSTIRERLSPITEFNLGLSGRKLRWTLHSLGPQRWQMVVPSMVKLCFQPVIVLEHWRLCPCVSSTRQWLPRCCELSFHVCMSGAKRRWSFVPCRILHTGWFALPDIMQQYPLAQLSYLSALHAHTFVPSNLSESKVFSVHLWPSVRQIVYYSLLRSATSLGNSPLL